MVTMVSWTVACAIVAGAGGLWWLLKGKALAWLRYDWQYLSNVIPTLVSMTKMNGLLLPDVLEKIVKRTPDKTFLIYKDSKYTYRQFDDKCNKIANTMLKIGLKRDQDVALLMPNTPEYLWTFYGLVKLGARPALINSNLRGKALLHCIKISSAKLLIIGSELLEALEAITDDLREEGITVYVQGTNQNELPGEYVSLDEHLICASSERLDPRYRDGLTEQDTACYIYTSGTTGLPKSALVNHLRAKTYSMVQSTAGITSKDVVYSTLPLYHASGMFLGVGAVIFLGATVVLEKKFSASIFWEQCRRHNVTVIQYIGELCRYLVARSEVPGDKNHHVRLAIGNGLRADIWKKFQTRFNIPRILEFYGATEGNTAFINTANMVGSVGRTSPLLKLLIPSYLVRFDAVNEEVMRDFRGRCIQCKPGEPGMVVTKISKRSPYTGYKGDEVMTNKKLLFDVFKEGDRYYNTGDLFIEDENGFLYFQDRIGDTFRWKGENVSTTEVSNVVSALPFIEDANVYGVTIPGNEGRAGMASVCLAQGHHLVERNLKEMYDYCTQSLPIYAQPKFVRILAHMQITGTFKQQKTDLLKDGFDPDKCRGDSLYFQDNPNRTYSFLTKDVFHGIIAGNVKL